MKITQKYFLLFVFFFTLLSNLYSQVQVKLSTGGGSPQAADLDAFWLSPSPSIYDPKAIYVECENVSGASGSGRSIPRSHARHKTVWGEFGLGSYAQVWYNNIWSCGKQFFNLLYSKDGSHYSSIDIYINDEYRGTVYPQNQNSACEDTICWGWGWDSFNYTGWIQVMDSCKVTTINEFTTPFPAASGERQIKIITQGDCNKVKWLLTDKPEWVDFIDPNSSEKESTVVTVGVKRNKTKMKREDFLEFSSECGETLLVPIIQKDSCRLVITNHNILPEYSSNEQDGLGFNLEIEGNDCYDVDWKINTNCSDISSNWYDISPTSATKNKKVNISLQKNESKHTRYLEIWAESEKAEKTNKLLISQLGECELKLDNNVLKYEINGGTKTVNVTIEGDCYSKTWIATKNPLDTWITQLNLDRESNKISITVSPNEYEARWSLIAISTQNKNFKQITEYVLIEQKGKKETEKYIQYLFDPEKFIDILPKGHAILGSVVFSPVRMYKSFNNDSLYNWYFNDYPDWIYINPDRGDSSCNIDIAILPNHGNERTFDLQIVAPFTNDPLHTIYINQIGSADSLSYLMMKIPNLNNNGINLDQIWLSKNMNKKESILIYCKNPSGFTSGEYQNCTDPQSNYCWGNLGKNKAGVIWFDSLTVNDDYKTKIKYRNESNDIVPIQINYGEEGSVIYNLAPTANSFVETDWIFINDMNLPVELVDFHVKEVGNECLLEWITASEINNWGFEVQRFVTDWETICFVEGRGTCVNTNSYSFYDDLSEVTSKEIKYRLKQIDLNGKNTYSKIVCVNFSNPSEFKLYQNYPNPFNPSTIIQYDIFEAGYVELSVINVKGQEIDKLISEEMVPGHYQVVWGAAQYANGIYFYKIHAGDNIDLKKMVLMK